MAVSKRLRYEILRRDSHTCRYCGASAPDVPLRVDHVTPVALGGTDEPSNLVTSCEPCNSGKSSASPDAHHVTDVADDALRWAAAMQQAAHELREQQGPKIAYREAFRAAWSEWTWERDGKKETFDLPKDWKGSLDAFREAGLPQDVWPDIVEKSMTNKTVRSENLFRYCCGIGWRMVKELQERARVIVGDAAEQVAIDSRTSVLDAAFAVWVVGMDDGEGAPSAERQDEFRRSLAGLDEWAALDPGRIVEAAQHATYFGVNDIAEAIRDLDRSRIWTAWISAWPKTYVSGETDDPWAGRYVGGPSDEAMERVKGKIEKLLDAEVPTFRIVQAATHAGFHKSTRIYRGLEYAELEAVDEPGWVARAIELWRVAFTASGTREPTPEESAELTANLRRIGDDGGFYVIDVHDAAAAAGSYQDPDLSTCLTRHLSVFEAAARPLAPAA
jgi:hypothetical protein